jgi:hypothetical protein
MKGLANYHHLSSFGAANQHQYPNLVAQPAPCTAPAAKRAITFF